MTDTTNNKTATSNTTLSTTSKTQLELKREGKVLLPGLHARMMRAQQDVGADPLTRDNRIAFMLDCSGSMGGNKLDRLKDACTSFVQHCNMGDTSIALDCFPQHGGLSSVDLSVSNGVIIALILGLSAGGGTPMADSMNRVLTSVPLTRGILVSDGQPDNPNAVLETARMYAEAQIPIDCLHIGDYDGGKELLQQVAEITGGKFLKFTDMNSLVSAFKYLTPAMYGMLTSGAVDAAELGAKELK